MALRRNKDTKLLLTWPSAENAESYRLLLRDSSTDKLVSKIECSRPSYAIDMRALHADHHYEWSVQKRRDKFEEWAYHVPYLRLFRPTDEPSETVIEWEPTGAALYRVVINDRQLGVAVSKDALVGTRYPVDWRRLIADHDHMYEIQELVPGSSEEWTTVIEYQPLPDAPEEVRIEFLREQAAPGARPLIFLWTCDTEVNLRRMENPVPDQAVDLQIFARSGEREYGITFMMDLLEEFNFRGTFFVDILLEYQLGRAALERVVESIVERGHDLQLHLHPSPNLLFAADPRLERFAPALASDNRDLFRGALEVAVELFVDRVGYAPVAYRSGAYHLCDDFLSVLPEFGILIDSSLYPFKNCRTSDWMRARTEPFWIGDVLEVPVSWMLRKGDSVTWDYGHEQLAPAKHGIHQDAFAGYRPAPAPGQTPATLVYLAHSFSFLSQRRPQGQKVVDNWNARYREQVPAEIFERIRMGSDHENVFFELPPDTDRIAVMTRLLHGLAARTDVVGGTLRDLHDGGLARWRSPRASAVDTVPVWDEGLQRPSAAPLQVYSRGLLERMHRDRSAA